MDAPVNGSCFIWVAAVSGGDLLSTAGCSRGGGGSGAWAAAGGHGGRRGTHGGPEPHSIQVVIHILATRFVPSMRFHSRPS